MDVEPNRPSDDDVRRFVLARLAEDEQRLSEGHPPFLDEAELRGRLRILRTDDGEGLRVIPGPAQAQDERAPVPFEEKARWLRAEVEATTDEALPLLLAAAYDTHHGWQEEWRT